MHRPGAHLSALLAHRCDGWPYEPWKALVGLARLYKPDEAHHPYDTFHTKMTSWVPYTSLLSSFPRGEPCVLCKVVHMIYKPLQPFCAFADDLRRITPRRPGPLAGLRVAVPTSTLFALLTTIHRQCEWESMGKHQLGEQHSKSTSSYLSDARGLHHSSAPWH